MRARVRSVVFVLACAGVVLGGGGCTYVRHRAEDMVEMVDLGFSFSSEPQFSLYGSLASVACLGYSDFDGTVLGLGGGFVGKVGHANECAGLMWYGREKVTWKQSGRYHRYRHPQGLSAIMDSPRWPGPAYFPACVHYVHVGWMGVVANARYAEMLDFLLGFIFIDIARDDGRGKGRWFCQ